MKVLIYQSGFKSCIRRRNFVPKIPSYRILDLVEAIGPTCRKEIIGIRAGEKIMKK